MAQEVKYGAIWDPQLDKGDTALPEHYLPELDLVTLIVKQTDGFLMASVWKKELNEQSDPPIWITAGGNPCQCTTLDEAKEYLESTIRLIGDQH